MESFIRKNWVGMFLLLLVLSLSFLGWIAIEINDGLAKFLEKSEGDDKRMDVIGSIFGTSVAIASALVAIILAKVALKYTENESKREFQKIIEERIYLIQSINNEILNAAKELKFIAYDSLSNIVAEISGYIDNKKNISIDDNPIFQKKLQNEFNRNKEPLKKFAAAIRKLDSNSLIYQHYERNLNNVNKKDYYNPLNVMDIAIAMENKYIDELNVKNVWNAISEKLTYIKKLEPNKRKWVVFSIIYGFVIVEDSDNSESSYKLTGALTVIEILLNLPSIESYIDVSKELDKEFWINHGKEADETIKIISGKNENEQRIKSELLEIKDYLINNEEILIFKKENNQSNDVSNNDVPSNFDSTFDFILKIAKGVAIEMNQQYIDGDSFLHALQYVNLNNFAIVVFSKMIGQTFSKIGKKSGGEKFLALAESKVIDYDSNMEMFISEAKKHFKNEKICSLN